MKTASVRRCLSQLHALPLTVQVGDHIEKLDGRNLVGCRHFEVAKALKEIPRGKKFILRVIEPLKSGFCKYRNNIEGASTGLFQDWNKAEFPGKILLEHPNDKSERLG